MKNNTPTVMAAAPDHFSEKTRCLWAAINAEFQLQPDAIETLRVALENLDLADKARALLRKQGLVLDGKKHPASDAVKLHDGMYLRAIRQLGLDIVETGAKAGRRS